MWTNPVFPGLILDLVAYIMSGFALFARIIANVLSVSKSELPSPEGNYNFVSNQRPLNGAATFRFRSRNPVFDIFLFFFLSCPMNLIRSAPMTLRDQTFWYGFYIFISIRFYTPVVSPCLWFRGYSAAFKAASIKRVCPAKLRFRKRISFPPLFLNDCGTRKTSNYAGNRRYYLPFFLLVLKRRQIYGYLRMQHNQWRKSWVTVRDPPPIRQPPESLALNGKFTQRYHFWVHVSKRIRFHAVLDFHRE